MWILLALISAVLLAGFQVSKKISLKNNRAITVLLIYLAINSVFSVCMLALLDVPELSLAELGLILIKSGIVLAANICAFLTVKYLDLTTIEPVQATRPILVVIAAGLIFGEELNPLQWVAVLAAILGILIFSSSTIHTGKRKNGNTKYLVLLALVAVLNVVSALYDKYLLGLGIGAVNLQAWYMIGQLLLVAAPVLLYSVLRKSVRQRKERLFEWLRLRWTWVIVLIPACLFLSDLAYLHALADPDALLSIVTILKHLDTVLTFLIGVLFFREKRVLGKFASIAVIFLAVVLICLSS
jgi:transporter family protein